MSYRIKAEDVPEELQDKINHEMRNFSLTSLEIAIVIKEAIEAGFVSPPCHVHRYLDELECQGGTLEPALFVGKPKELGDEHWKGQTE